MQLVLFEKEREEPFDKECTEHLEYVLFKSIERASCFGIDPAISMSLVQGVTGNILPSIGSTNCFIAGVLVNEAIKAVSGSNRVLDNYLMYFGGVGVHSSSFAYQKDPACLVCRPPV